MWTRDLNTSSFECSNSKNSGVMVALASLDLTGKTNNDVSPKLCGNVFCICTTMAKASKRGTAKE